MNWHYDEIDIDIINYLSEQTARFSQLKSQFKDSNPIKELTKEIYKELDFDLEYKNMVSFAKKFEDDENVYVPRAFSSFSTKNVITMEYVEGIKVTDVEGLKKAEIEPETVSNNLVDTGLTQIFDHRFFHGDPHPGNIIVLEGGKICFIDFGLMGRISNRQRENIIDLITAYSRNDYKKLTRIVMKYAPSDMYIDEEKLENEVSELLDKYYDLDLSEIDVGEALLEIVNFILQYRITLNFNSYLLIKALSSYEGIGKRIFPQFDITTHAEKFTRKMIREQFSPKKIAHDVYISSTDAFALLKNFPNELMELINMLQGGRLKLNI